MYDLFRNDLEEHSYVKMIIESYDTLSKSRAVQFLKQASSTESKIALLDAMKDKVTLSTDEIKELVPLTISSSFDMADTSSFDNLSYLSLFTPQRSPHMFTSFNNAAQSTRTSSNANKRSSLLQGLFGRRSSKKRTSVAKSSLKKRVISGGDQVKLSSTRLHRTEQPYSLKHHYGVEIQEDTIENRRKTDHEVQLLSQGLRYDFKQVKTISDIKPSSKTNSMPIPFVSHSSFIQDKSLSSLLDPTLIRPHVSEQKHHIQSAHNVVGSPTTNTTLEKITFNADQHKYHLQTPIYYSPKPLSTIELLTKKYISPRTSQNSTGLLWYNASHQISNGISLLSKRVSTSKGKDNLDSSSDSQDTSSSSNSSSSSGTSSSSSSTTSSQKTTKSNSTSTKSSSPSMQQSMKTIGPFNRNENDREDIIQIDLNSSTSRTSTSTKSGKSSSNNLPILLEQFRSSSTSIQPCYQRSISRKQSSSIFSVTTTSENDTSTIATKNNNAPSHSDDKPMNRRYLTIDRSLLTGSDLLSSINHQTRGKFKVKRQCIQSSMIIE